jgi:vacuolar-type H+-ATPase subunit H
MKKFFKWTGISFLVVLILLIIAPFLFKGKIIEMVKKTANENVNATINFSDVSLSLIRNFPNLRVTIDSFTVENKAPFYGVKLASIGSLEAVVDIKSVFGDEIQIKKIGIVDPIFDIRVTESGIANYDIALPDTSTTTPTDTSSGGGFKMKLKEYYIKNGKINYDDKSMPMLISLEALNHEGSGDFTQDIFSLKTSTKAEKTTFWFDGVTYINKVKSDIQADIQMDMKNSKYTLAGNAIKLNELLLEAGGWVSMPKEDIDMDIQFKTTKTDFKQLLSMIPAEFASDVSGVDASGNMALDGYVRGTYNESSMPGIGLNIGVDNGRFRYPDLPKSVDNINVKAAIVADMNVMDKTTVDIDKFHIEMAGNPVDMTLKLRTPESDPFIDFACKAFLDLDKVKEFIPLEKGDKVHGQINADIGLKGNYSAVEKEKYEEFDAHGVIDIKNVLFESDSLPYDLNVNTATFTFNPAFLDLSNFAAQIGRSDIAANGKIENYLAYALKDSLLAGSFSISSNLMDLNEFMTDTAPEAPSQPAATATPESSMSAIELPGNVDFELQASFAKMIYDKNEITNVKGGIHLKDKIAYLKNLAMNVLDGTVVMSGNYNAQDIAKPKMNFNFDIKDMDINKAANQFNTVDKLAPVAKACNGKFTTKFDMQSDLDQGMMPINASVNGIGNLSTKNVVIKDFAPLVKLAEKINLDKLKEAQTINDVNVSFKIKDGVVNVNPFTIKFLGGIPAKVSGYTTLDQEINYNVDMDVPFDKFPSGAVNQANTWIGDLNKKLGSNISIGTKVNVIALITGTIKDPKIGVTSKALGADALASLKEQAIAAVKEQVVEKATEIRDDLIKKAREEKEKLVAEARKQADALVAEAQKQSDKVKKEGEELAKKGKDAAYKSAQDIENSAKNPFEKAAKKLAADKVRKEADSAYNKAVEETNKKAAGMVSEADKKGDSLVKAAEAQGDKLINEAQVKSQQGIDKVK